MGSGAQAAGAAVRKSASALGADEIIPRDFRFNIVGNRKRHWFGGSVYKSALMDGLSMFLPEGEKFFIRSLKHYATELGDKELAREINGYAVQEAFHTREHEEYNKAMTLLGYDTEKMEQPIRYVLRSVKAPILRLAGTCAIEHITATVSSATLRRPELLDDADPAYRRLWMWHALEEIEHKAVALDVYKAATKNMSGFKRYAIRATAMNTTLLTFMYISLRNMRIYAKNDGVKTGVRFWLKMFKVLLISPGYWRMTIRPLLGYYSPWFDPHNDDDVELINKGREWLAAEFGAGYKPPAREAT